MKKSLGLMLLILSLMVFLTACGGGGGGGNSTPGDTTPSGTTTVSGKVQLSSTAALSPSKFAAIASGSVLTDATVELYDADRPEWLYPVAITLTGTGANAGVYTLGELAHSADNGGSYTDHDLIPTGNYTIIAYKVVLGVGTYIAVQPYVKKFDGAITGNDLIAQDKGTQPAVLSMFGLPKNSDGTYGSNTTPLAMNAAIQVTFNTAMARLTVLSDISIKNSQNVDVQGSWKVSADLLSATFYPTNNLTEGTVYTVTVGTGAKNLYGTAIAAIVTGKFKTVAQDTTPADAIKYMPVLKTNVPITTPIQIAADKPLDLNTFTITSSPSIGDKPAVLFAGKGSTAYPYVYEIVPAGLLQLNTDYAITVSGAKDIVGLTLTTFTFNFKTEAVHTAPTVLASSPTGTSVGINDVVSATFSATMDSTTINASTFTVSGVTGIVNSNGTTATFIPSQPLAYSTTYTATITTGAKDLAGSALANNYTWTFKTTGPPDTTPPTTAASPAGGLYNTTKNVTLTANEAATIYYTTDGTTPTTSSAVYSTSMIPIASTTTLKFFAKDSAGNSEGVKTEIYTIDTTAPTITSTTPAGAATGIALQPAITVVFSETMDSTSITASTFTLAAGSVAVTGTVVPTGTTATFTPSNSLSYSTTYTATVTTGVKDVAGNALASNKVWSFTTIAAPDTTAPTVYLIGPGNNSTDVPVNTVIKATFSEAIDATTIAAAFTVGGVTGTVTYDAATTTATFTPSASLSYSTIYSVVISTVVKDTAGNALAGNYAWSFTTAAPPDTTPPVTTASPAGGLFKAAQTVTLSSNETATVYYTVDGSTPTTGSTALSTSGTINITATTTLKFFAKDTAGNIETTVKTETYTIDTVAPITTASPAGGTYGSTQSVTLTPNETAPMIYYSINGSTPTTAYTGPITIASTTTLKFLAIDTAGNSETVKTETYTIDTVAPITTASPTGGTYGSTQSVTLTANEAATIYYTTNGTTPTTSSTVYTGSISISATTTLKYFAKDTAGNSETVKTSTYTIGQCAVLTPPAGVNANAIVSAVYGNNATANGTCLNPYKTITAALVSVTTGTVWVAPGTYDATLGETFPITIPAGVTLVGDETNKGNGTTPTLVKGHGTVPTTSYYATVLGSQGAKISGFTIGNANYIVSGFGVYSSGADFTVVNNTFDSSTYGGVQLRSTGKPLVEKNVFNTSSYGVYSFGTGSVIIQDNNLPSPCLPIDGGGSPIIRRNSISGCGQVGIQVQSGSPLIDSNTFTSTGYATYGALRITGSSTPKIRGNTFTLSGGPAATIVSAAVPDFGTAADSGQNTFAGTNIVIIQHDAATTFNAIGNTWHGVDTPACGTMIVTTAGGTVNWGPNAGNSCPLAPCPAATTAPTGVNASSIVSASSGNDATADGTCYNPYKTVTAALSSMTSGTVWVAPGTYDSANGEVFPITLPSGVSLIGDEANKGQGTTHTKIIGGGALTVGGTCGTYGTTIYAGASSVLAGLELTDGNTAVSFPMTLVVRNNNITLRNNAIVNNTDNGVYVCNGSTNHVISGNIIKSNSLGLGFIGGGVGSKVESNTITNNGTGVEYDSAGGDLGGGSAGSAGGNTISCNTGNDIWTNNSITIDAKNNYWDHNPPVLNTATGWAGCSGKDLCNFSLTATINTTGSWLAATNCP